ncbi:MAG: MBOAT family protein [Planctomycetes bacterium]|nr:MBOAT family protein [Planctomycetota bacterium]
MVFSSLIFLCLFLPVVLGAYFLLPRFARNWWLLIASLLFYAWGEGWYVLVMVWTFAFNWGMALAIERFQARSRTILALAIAANLALLVFWKYTNFLVDGALNPLLALVGAPALHIDHIHLPIGISFFVFQAISYVIDVHRKDVPASRSLVGFGMYKALFPQLIAGPIVRYKDVAHEIYERRETIEMFREGVRRFCAGLAKKVIIADVMAGFADRIFGLPASELSTGVAWIGVVCYALQIYFDFSGYSDMAIGIGRMFGFHFRENFNHPYVAQSVGDFWRRWHMSLSTWFRDYLYFPLGGSRCAPWKVARNLFVVFVLCGLWHGASWVFLAWGLWHGVFLALEHFGMHTLIDRLWRPLRHGYCLLAVLGGWVLFRVETLDQARTWFTAMAGFGARTPDWDGLITRELLIIGALGLIFAFGWGRSLAGAARAAIDRRAAWLGDVLEAAAIAACLVWCIAALTANAYTPFIYFRF